MNGAWRLVDEHDNLVAVVVAETAIEARDVFKQRGLRGARVKRGLMVVDQPRLVCDMSDSELVDVFPGSTIEPIDSREWAGLLLDD